MKAIFLLGFSILMSSQQALGEIVDADNEVQAAKIVISRNCGGSTGALLDSVEVDSDWDYAIYNVAFENGFASVSVTTEQDEFDQGRRQETHNVYEYECEFKRGKKTDSYEVLDSGNKRINLSVGTESVEAAQIEYFIVKLKAGAVYSCPDIDFDKIDPLDDINFFDLCDFDRHYYTNKAYFGYVKKKLDQGFSERVFEINENDALPVVQWSSEQNKWMVDGELQDVVLVMYKVKGEISKKVLDLSLAQLAKKFTK